MHTTFGEHQCSQQCWNVCNLPCAAVCVDSAPPAAEWSSHFSVSSDHIPIHPGTGRPSAQFPVTVLCGPHSDLCNQHQLGGCRGLLRHHIISALELNNYSQYTGYFLKCQRLFKIKIKNMPIMGHSFTALWGSELHGACVLCPPDLKRKFVWSVSYDVTLSPMGYQQNIPCCPRKTLQAFQTKFITKHKVAQQPQISQ
jgi:hypothetical protein